MGVPRGACRPNEPWVVDSLKSNSRNPANSCPVRAKTAFNPEARNSIPIPDRRFQTSNHFRKEICNLKSQIRNLKSQIRNPHFSAGIRLTAAIRFSNAIVILGF
jgi:hypothetical protein